MIVVYCADKNLYEVLPTAIRSLLAHNDVEKIYCILEDDYSDSLQNSKIEIVNMHKCDLPNCTLNASGRYPYAAIIRCFLDLVLKEDKIIYLDVDTIVTGNISELWYTNIHDNYIAAVPEYDEYYNSGVMLMNLDYMRKHNSSEALYDFLESRVYTFPDQEAINNVFAGKIRKLPPKFNAWNLTKDPYATPFVIRHFTGIDKPWSSNPRDLRDVELWNRYFTTEV